MNTQIYQIKGIIFDFDMTLVDSKKVGDEALEYMEEYGISRKDFTDKEIWGMTHLEFCKKLSEVNNHKLSWQEISKLNQNFLIKNFLKLKLNCLELLEELNKKKIKIGIVSNNKREFIKTTLSNKYNKNINFEFILTCEDLEDNSTKTDLLLKGLEILSLKRNEVMYVGDHVNDILAAKKAGVISVGISTGVHSFDELKQKNPDILIRNLNELNNHLNNS